MKLELQHCLGNYITDQVTCLEKFEPNDPDKFQLTSSLKIKRKMSLALFCFRCIKFVLEKKSEHDLSRQKTKIIKKLLRLGN